MKEDTKGEAHCGCGKLLSQHSQEDLRTCALTEEGVGYVVLQSVGPERAEFRAEFMASECSVCNRIFGRHSDAELEECLRVIREKKSSPAP
jgi:hypothetical protein